MNLISAPDIDLATYYEIDFDERQNAKRPLHTLEVGDTVVLKTNPHGEDIPSVFTANITEVPRESDKRLMRDGHRIMADIRFERKDGHEHTFHLDNRYVHGHHSGLGRPSDIARGLTAYDISAFAESDENGESRLMTDGGTDVSVEESGDMVNVHYGGDMVASIDTNREELCVYKRDSEEPVTVIDLSDENDERQPVTDGGTDTANPTGLRDNRGEGDENSPESAETLLDDLREFECLDAPIHNDNRDIIWIWGKTDGLVYSRVLERVRNADWHIECVSSSGGPRPYFWIEPDE